MLQKEPKGRGGLLGLFILGLIVGPLISFGQAYSGFYTVTSQGVVLNPSFVSYMYIVVMVEGIFYWRAASILFKANDRRAPFRALAHIWIGYFFGCVAEVFIVGKFYPGLMADVVSGILGGFLWVIVWTLYIFFSKRVKNTYCEDLPASVPNESVRMRNSVETPVSQTAVIKTASVKQENAEPVQTDGEDLVHELRVFKLPSSGQWYWAAKNRRGQLLARGGPLLRDRKSVV